MEYLAEGPALALGLALALAFEPVTRSLMQTVMLVVAGNNVES